MEARRKPNSFFVVLFQYLRDPFVLFCSTLFSSFIETFNINPHQEIIYKLPENKFNLSPRFIYLYEMSFKLFVLLSVFCLFFITNLDAVAVGSIRQRNSSKLNMGSTSRIELSGTVTCSSRNYRPALCSIPGITTSLVVTNQRSRSSCTAGSSFFSFPGSVLVTDGCRATFKYTAFESEFPFKTVLCESYNFEDTVCPVGTDVDSVRLFKQISNSVCDDSSFGAINGDSIEVKNGCRGVFGAFDF